MSSTATALAIDPYDPIKNPLGTKKLSAAYLNAGNAFVQGQCYALMIEQQVDLDVSGLDAGLAVKVAAYQQQLRGHATYFLNSVSSGFIGLIADGSNTALLMEAGLQMVRKDILGSLDSTATRTNAVQTLDAISEGVGDTLVHAGSLATNASVTSTTLNSLSAKLDDAIQTAMSGLQASAKETAQKIDSLTKATYQNIEDIVSAANEVGSSVTDLGVGVLTLISGQIKEPDTKAGGKTDTGGTKGGDSGTSSSGTKKDDTKKDDAKKEAGGTGKTAADKDAAGGNKGSSTEGGVGTAVRSLSGVAGLSAEPKAGESKSAPSVQFAVSAIKAGMAGVGKWAAAQKALEQNNAELAQAYQELASQSALIAIAKVIQAQKDLFIAAIDDLLSDVQEIKMNWAAVVSGVGNYAAQVAALSDQISATGLSTQAGAAATMWTDYGTTLSGIQRSLTGWSGSLATP